MANLHGGVRGGICLVVSSVKAKRRKAGEEKGYL